MNSSRRNSAYTLVELLVVIGIIAVLSALLFAVFSRAREQGRAASCKNNLHQLSLAFQQYNSDNGTFPCWYNQHEPANPSPSPYPGIPWSVRIMPYLKSAAVFQCPSEATPASSNPMFPGGSDQTYISGYSDYSYNLNLSSTPESKISQPSEIIMVFDDGPGSGYEAQTSAPMSPDGDRHSGGANFAFVDGHIKWINVDQASLTTLHFFDKFFH